MSTAQSILEDLQAEIGCAHAHLVRAEGETPAARIKFRELSIESLRAAQHAIERATKLIEAELYKTAQKY